jgi:hypothetical protein
MSRSAATTSSPWLFARVRIAPSGPQMNDPPMNRVPPSTPALPAAIAWVAVE